MDLLIYKNIPKYNQNLSSSSAVKIYMGNFMPKLPLAF